MTRNYWLDLPTHKTWEEFLNKGAGNSGYRGHKRKTCERVKTGNYLFCYLIKVSRFVEIVEVKLSNAGRN
jgi:hypothetical protein